MRRSGMMKEKTTNKNVRNRRLLLSSYWFYKVFSGANVLKTTLNVLLMEKRAAATANPQRHRLFPKTGEVPDFGKWLRKFLNPRGYSEPVRESPPSWADYSINGDRYE